MIAHRHPQPVPPSRVVVLGASGFVGGAIVEEMARLGVETLPLSSSDVDLCQPEAAAALRCLLRREDAVVMVSAITPDKGKDAGTFLRNVAMGAHVSTVLEAPVCSHVVYISSDAVYDDAATPVRETSCCSPSTFHGLMHVARERMFRQAAQQSQTPLLVIRPCAVYGAGDTHQGYGPNRFVRTAITEHAIRLFGHGEEQRDHLYIKDLSRLIGLGVLRRSEGTLNAASGTSVSFGDLARLVAELSGEEVRIDATPRQQPVTHRHMDLMMLRHAFPSFRPTPIRAGIAEMLRTLSDERQPAPTHA